MHNGRNYSFTHISTKLQWREDGNKHTELLVMNLRQLGKMSRELLCCTISDEWQLDRSCNCKRDQQDSRQQSSREMWRENETKQLRHGAPR